MREIENKIKVFINGLLLHPMIQKLKLVDDKGITVSTHTYDVLKVATKKIKKKYRDDLDEASEHLDLFAIVVGIIIHDTTKASLRLNGSKTSHSIAMKKQSDMVQDEARFILEEVENFTKLIIKDEIFENIIHIVASHHGKWGKVIPQTEEALIVHEADKYSAVFHRITPIGGREVVKLMSEGFSREEIAKVTGYTVGIIDDRLKRSKKQLNINSNKALIDYYEENGAIPEGDEFFSRRIRETEKLLKKVEQVGFEELILKNVLIDNIYAGDVFK